MPYGRDVAGRNLFIFMIYIMYLPMVHNKIIDWLMYRKTDVDSVDTQNKSILNWTLRLLKNEKYVL